MHAVRLISILLSRLSTQILISQRIQLAGRVGQRRTRKPHRHSPPRKQNIPHRKAFSPSHWKVEAMICIVFAKATRISGSGLEVMGFHTGVDQFLRA
jgi:hypothetical protein